MNKRILMIEYSKRFLLLPYLWGGNHPAQGYDCSGFIQEVLAAVGLDPAGDQTAQTLYNLLKQGSFKEEMGPGAILFFGASKHQITHVALQIDGFHMIEAGSGRATTRNVQDAIRDHAFIRIRPISNRSDLVSGLIYIGD